MKKHFLLPLALSLVALAGCEKPVEQTTNKKVREVTFNLNYTGAAEGEKKTVEKGSPVTKPETDPTRDGYKFLGWTVDESGFTPYDFSTRVNKDTVVYAAWEANDETEKNRYIFEAEYTPSAIKFQGATYSGGATGKACIGYDYDGDLVASNGYYVHFMYVKYEPDRNGEEYGSKLVFNFEAAAAGTISILMRVSAEYGQEGVDITVDKDEWKAKLNGTQLDYETLVFKDVPIQGAGYKAFEDHTLAVNVNVQAGANKLEFITDNQKLLFGTAQATAPMLDCLKIKSSTELTWSEADPTQVPEVE